MTRNLDIAALRSLLALAEMGGVTRAARQVNLSQSAVSLQIKRLEETFGHCLIERRGRGVALTARGEALVASARGLLALNDEIVMRMTTASDAAGRLRVGMPCDLVQYRVPEAVRRFGEANPSLRLVLRTEVSATLQTLLEEGELDLILTTEAEPGPEAETLCRLPLVWVGAPGGAAWRRSPLPFAAVIGCAYSRAAMARLAEEGVVWTIAAEASMIESLVAADLAVYAMLRGAVASGLAVVEHGGALPGLPDFAVAMQLTTGPRRKLAERMATAMRAAFAAPHALAA